MFEKGNESISHPLSVSLTHSLSLFAVKLPSLLDAGQEEEDKPAAEDEAREEQGERIFKIEKTSLSICFGELVRVMSVMIAQQVFCRCSC